MQQIQTENYAEVVHGDFRKEWPKLELDGTVDLVFMDPPFNIGQDYSGYDDKVSAEEQESLVHSMCMLGAKALRPGGRMCIHVPYEMLYLVLKHTTFQRELNSSEYSVDPDFAGIWFYRFAQNNEKNFGNAHCHLLTFVKVGGPVTLNSKDVLVPSDRAAKYDDKRTMGKLKGEDGMRMPFDVWGVEGDGKYWGRVQGNNKERVPGCPNQLPEVYLGRILKAWTNPSDLVVDFFAGSGTTAVVAKALGRSCITFDVSETNIGLIKSRLQRGSVRFSDEG